MPEQKRPEPKRLFMETYGCQMNVYDSERMRDVLTPLATRSLKSQTMLISLF